MALLFTSTPESLFRALAWMGGVSTTVVGSWISGKINAYHDRRTRHLEDIKKTVLIPIRDELDSYEPFVFHRQPLFSVAYTTTAYQADVPLTESPLQAERALIAQFQTGWLFRGTEPALTEDVRRNHFSELAEQLNKFVQDWAAYTGKYQFQFRRLANDILVRSDLPKFPNQNAVGWPRPEVMHLDLALLVYMRCFGFPTSPLKIQRESGSPYWSIDSESGTKYAVGFEGAVTSLLESLNSMLVAEQQAANELLREALVVQEEFVRLRSLLDFAIASHRLRHHCELVRFT